MPIQTIYPSAPPVNRFACLLLAVEKASKADPFNGVDFDRLPDVFVYSQNFKPEALEVSAQLPKADLGEGVTPKGPYNLRQRRKNADKLQNYLVMLEDATSFSDLRNQLAREEGFKNYYDKLNEQARKNGFKNHLDRRNHNAQKEGFESYYHKRQHQVLVKRSKNKRLKSNPFSACEIF